MSATTPPTEKDSDLGPTFSKLPAELRNAVYRYVLTSSGDVELDLKVISKLTNLFRTCKQIRSEATKIFWAENTFTVFLNKPVNTEEVLYGGKAACACKLLQFAGRMNANSVLRLIITYKCYMHQREICEKVVSVVCSKLSSTGVPSTSIEVRKAWLFTLL
jgi:hypothetical protein